MTKFHLKIIFIDSILFVFAPVLRGLSCERAAITNFFDRRDCRLFNRSSTNIFEVGRRDTAFSINI
jgi:hypothetical protein